MYFVYISNIKLLVVKNNIMLLKFKMATLFPFENKIVFGTMLDVERYFHINVIMTSMCSHNPMNQKKVLDRQKENSKLDKYLYFVI
jgi:hypothetical protein